MAYGQFKHLNSNSITDYCSSQFATIDNNKITSSFTKGECYFIIYNLSYFEDTSITCGGENVGRTNLSQKILFVPRKDNYASCTFKLSADNKIIRANVYTLKEIINEDTKATHIGIQGKSGQLFMVNNEPFVLGRSGIWELMEESIPIKSFGVAAEPNINFIIDYE